MNLHPYRYLPLAAAILSLLLPVESAAAKTNHHRPHCRHGYTLRHVTHKRHGKRVRVLKCVKRHATSKPPQSTQQTPSAHGQRAHLDPSFVQDPSNPFAVAYDYSVAPPAGQTLPDGILNLYSDGNLACSMNVGGDVQGGRCPVTYTSLGTHQVTVYYVSGSLTSTETDVEVIPPFATSTDAGMSKEFHSSGPYGWYYVFEASSQVTSEHGYARDSKRDTYRLVDTTAGTTVVDHLSSEFAVYPTPNGGGNMTVTYTDGSGTQQVAYAPAGDSLGLVALFPGEEGYLPSTSAPANIDTTHP